jgi:ATP-dependent DNA helicase DinG
MSPLEQLFDSSGPLSRAAPGYRTRSGQILLAQAIEDTIGSRTILVAEAGTGVGKTFAYLAPLLQTQGKALISTATRHLQDQLFLRDLPRLKSALGVSAQISVLKGRSNYLCLYRLEQHKEEGRFGRREDAQAFTEIVRFASHTTTGDISECVAVSESAAVWAQATSTRENCLGQNCPRVNDCHVMAARKRAAEADIVVVNHHLLCADMALRDEGFGELLPTVDYVVIDEAHALADIATQFFSQSLSTQLLGHLARDSLAIGLQHARDAASWPDLCGAVEKAAAELRLCMPDAALGGGMQANVKPNTQPLTNRRIGWDSLDQASKTRWQEALNAVTDSVIAINQVLEVNASRHLELAQLHALSQEMISRLGMFCEQDSDAPVVRWMESSRYALTLHITPYDIRDKFQQEIVKHQRAWIFVSATLAIGGSFAHFLERLGLEEARTLIASSPFDFQAQGLLLVPEKLPDPKAPNLITQLLDQPEIADLINTVGGGIFILCTSHRSVGHARDWMGRWVIEHPDRRLLVQGEIPRHQLIEEFRAHGNAILIGSHSFWEGVDVPGDALVMVLIDKLPFAPPDDPILEARARWLERQGRDAFTSIQLPEAAIQLKQGVGRLIRSESDRGLVVIGDRRLADTPYGRRIIRSLPGFKRTRCVEEAKVWLKALARV